MADRVIEAVMGVGLGGYFFFQGIGIWRLKRVIENTPLSKVASVAMGEAELAGKVRAIKSFKAPFSGRDCVYCSYRVEVPQKKRGWHTVAKGILQNIFYLDDGSGKILVNPEGADFHGAHSFQRIVGGGWGSGESTAGISTWFSERQAKSILGSLSTMGRHRFTEYVILPDDQVFVGGAVSQVRHSVNGVVREENIVLARSNGHFILSTHSEEALLSRFGWTAPLQIVGGSVLLLACLWYVVEHFGLERLIR
jgi:hypothetical protein